MDRDRIESLGSEQADSRRRADLGKISTSLAKLFARDKEREKKLEQIRFILEYGSRQDYLDLLVSWNVPVASRRELLEQFDAEQRSKRGLAR